jgi:uncharacterized protein YbbC (DUF1343 family)
MSNDGGSKIVLIVWCIVANVQQTYPFSPSFRLGIENLSPELIELMRAKRVGLVTNQTGVDQSGRKTVDLLQEKGISVCVLFAPEHGIDGFIGAEKAVAHAIDKQSGLRVVSLYPSGTHSKVIKSETFNDIDIIIFDIQDCGMRHYTYISTLFEVLKAAAAFGKQVIVCDRPNPLGGIMEGPLVEKDLQSFISIAPIPLRHGLTIGEVARYFNTAVLEAPAVLHVVPMKGYCRFAGIPGELLAPLSPNIPCKASCYGYSFLGLLGEIQPFYVGVGTEKPFQLIMLPKKLQFPADKWRIFAALLEQMQISNTLGSHFDLRKKQWFEGVQIQIDDINRVSSFTTFMRIVSFFKDAGVSLKFAKLFDKAIGTVLVRGIFENGGSPKVLEEQVNMNLKKFFDAARGAFLYDPVPQIV